MKKLLYIYVIILGMFTHFYTVFGLNLKEEMQPTTPSVIDTSRDGVGVLTYLAQSLRDLLLWGVGLVAVGVFLYFGFKLITARGNEEEMKKTLLGFVYAVIGLAIIPLAFVIVRLVSSINISPN